MPGPEIAAKSKPEVEAMIKTNLTVCKERVLTLRRRLRADLGRMAVAVLDRTAAEANGGVSITPIQTEEIGNESLERESTLTLLESKEDMLEQIEVALQRMEDGAYGVCERCGGKIPRARLEAIPYAIHCVKCASQLELT